jgi:hypothetical protein
MALKVMQGICSNRHGNLASVMMPIHISQVLKANGISKISDLELMTISEVRALPGMTAKCVAMLRFGLARDGYHIGREPDVDASCYRFEDPWNPKPRLTPFAATWQDFLTHTENKTNKRVRRPSKMTLTQRWRKFAAEMNKDSGYAGSHPAALEMTELAEASGGANVPRVLWSNELGSHVVKGLLSKPEYLSGVATLHAELSALAVRTKQVVLASCDLQAHPDLRALMDRQSQCLHELAVLVEEFETP